MMFLFFVLFKILGDGLEEEEEEGGDEEKEGSPSPPGQTRGEFNYYHLLSHFHILPCGWPMNAKQHGRIWKWILGNLEIYRILERAIDTSPVEKFNYVAIR
jgi:hypothetical protein